MCVIALALGVSARWSVVVAANRDESYARATTPLGWWPDAPHVCAGRDRVAGGTWMGATRDARFAALTNLRDACATLPADALSRGTLTAEFLLPACQADAPQHRATRVAAQRDRYAGFNLVLGDLRLREPWWSVSSGEQAPQPLAPGVHALSNGPVGHDWFKTRTLGAALRSALSDSADDDALFEALLSTAVPPDEELPDTGIGLARERLLAPVFVRAPGYGTRASTVLRASRDGRVRIVERTFEADREAPVAQRTVEFSLG